jgi:hypothetical protein
MILDAIDRRLLRSPAIRRAICKRVDVLLPRVLAPSPRAS